MRGPHRWRPLTDLTDPDALTDRELAPLQRIWSRQKAEMEREGQLQEFLNRQHREWSIETGIIENVYTLDRGVTQTLIERGLDASLIPHMPGQNSEAVAAILHDHYAALELLFAFVRDERTLSTSFIKELHAALLRNQPTHTVVDPFGRRYEAELIRGEYKTLANNPTREDGSVHEYCPPEHVASEMDRLVALHAEHVQQGLPPEVQSAWLHHRFTQIHPFADGNGRVARAIASIVFIKANWFPLTITRDQRARYIAALETADSGNLRPLTDLLVESQRDAVIKATELALELRPPETPDQAIAAIRDRLVQKGKLSPLEFDLAKRQADASVNHARTLATNLAATLHDQVGRFDPGSFHFSTGEFGKGTNAARDAALAAAGHTPLPGEYDRTVLLTLTPGGENKIVISFHALGPRWRGIIGIVAYLELAGRPPQLTEGGTFQINYEEDEANLRNRFQTWLDRTFTRALSDWRQTL